ncbi:CCA tRNA nucleotidyltransferase [Bacillus suaedae]|nr:CCA tRNA nucleotidyltransferase [Bacillus suaedae]
MEEANEILSTLNKEGFHAYIVGGAVRDFLLNRRSADIDIVTSAQPDEIRSLFPKTIQMNTEHQTVIVRLNSQLYEVTTFRGDSLQQDLFERDLTINSMAMDVEGNLIDPANGEKDLQGRYLRSVDPVKTMTDDPLRMLRVARFVSELGFAVDEDLMKVIYSNHSILHSVAVERVAKEWLKLFKGIHRQSAFKLLINSSMYESIPGLTLDKDVLNKLSRLDIDQDETDVVCWTVYCLVLNVDNANILKCLALSSQLIRDVNKRLVGYWLRTEQLWTNLSLYDTTIQVAKDIEYIRSLLGEAAYKGTELEQIWGLIPIHSRSELAITGRDLLNETNKQSGPWIKDELRAAEEAVVTNNCENEKECLLEWLERRRK